MLPATYYIFAARNFGPSEADLEDAYLANRLLSLWQRNRRVYGRRKLWQCARKAGIDIGRDQCQRLMKLVGIEGVRRGKRTTITTCGDVKAPRSVDRIKRAWDQAHRPDQWWVADFTYVWTLEDGFVYTAFIEDVFSRRILGWVVCKDKETKLVVSAVEQALLARRSGDGGFSPEGIVHHSDAGSQYMSMEFSRLLSRLGIDGSIGTVGDALDNALMESAIGLYKTELIDFAGRSWENVGEVEKETARWIYWYNYERLHSAIGYLSPVECEQSYYDRLSREPVQAA